MTVRTRSGKAQGMLNELEFVGGYIWANIFLANIIVKICPCNGIILDTINLLALRKIETQIVADRGEDASYDHGNNVLNGIAYNSHEDVFFVTGKRWNIMFKVKLNKPMSKDDQKCQC